MNWAESSPPPRQRPVTIYIAEDDAGDRAALEIHLRREGFSVHTFTTGESFLEASEQEAPDIALVDIVMPGIGGIETLSRFSELHPQVPVILLTGQGTVENAFEAMRRGAYDFIPKPFEMARLNVSIHNALRTKDLTREVHKLQGELRVQYDFQNLIGTSPAITRVLADLERLADSDLSVLIQGEAGTGKELVARTIHYNSRRGEGSFFVVKCSDMRQDLLEESLFGPPPGGGAPSRRSGGRWEQAHGGTLLLDDVDRLSLPLQEKLLGQIIGQKGAAGRGRAVDVRLISSSQKDLGGEAVAGRFNPELINHLAPFRVTLPPLRERSADIPLLVKRFLCEFAHRSGSLVPAVTPEAMETLAAYSWPGNIRELKNVIRQTVILTDADILRAEDLPPSIREGKAGQGEGGPVADFEEFLDTLEGEGGPIPALKMVEEKMIRKTLAKTGGDVTQSASILGISRATLYRRLKAMQISRTDP